MPCICHKTQNAYKAMAKGNQQWAERMLIKKSVMDLCLQTSKDVSNSCIRISWKNDLFYVRNCPRTLIVVKWVILTTLGLFNQKEEQQNNQIRTTLLSCLLCQTSGKVMLKDMPFYSKDGSRALKVRMRTLLKDWVTLNR